MESTSKRYFIELAFIGTAYHGWQIQPNAVTVQELLDKALTTILRQPVNTVGCGRTDTGVHATQLYAHFDVRDDELLKQPDECCYKLNALLPHDIAVRRLFAVAPGAHARFDAVKRSYEYHTHFGKNPFLHGRSWQLRGVPDVDAMNEAAKILLEYDDFSCFSKSNTQVHTHICEIMRAEWLWVSDQQLVFYISANRFLRNMVRAIVGTLIEIGRGENKPAYMHTVIQSKSRAVAGSSVPACGLYLTEVIYPYIDHNTDT
ncbi:tRNA pseudouridine38-40 synthase [Parapedobacter composti]|uniref:tRNA pseudouridine synthase A n=1 Tax=Parapedobacter composti TaxID=623281 RepID=A0A1I1IYT9_9SPHI|nr:tRNA pseudouridine(38-40) synthase TruA [Parapedobacter composti]SFC41041.1 tRNA pseudouridine38-40 synthase [Parapedobacter composti]